MAWFGGFTLETYNRIPGDYEEVTVGVSVGGFSQAKIMPTTGPYARLAARSALVSSEGGDIRFRIDGGPPSTKQRPLLYQRRHPGAHRHPGHPAIPGHQVRRDERGVAGNVFLLKSGQADNELHQSMSLPTFFRVA